MSTTLVKKGMPYVRLGTSGLKVSKIILGLMSYGNPDWQKWILPGEEAIEHIRIAYEAGVNTFDVANSYSNGLTEVVLGNAIKKLNLPRDEIVVLTKLFFVVGRSNEFFLSPTHDPSPDERGYVNQYGLSRKHIFDSVKKSLERLQLDYIDVLQCHRFDYDTPIGETMQALHDVVQAGYVRYLGMSSCWAWQYYAITNKLTPFISMQNHYNLVHREDDREMFPTLKYFGVGAIPWSPLGRGVLTRPLSETTTRSGVDSLLHNYARSDATAEIINRVEKVAKDKGISMAQVSLAWVMNREGVSAPIVGTTSLDKLKELLAAVHVTLTPEETRYLEEPYRARDIIGHL
ncbi:hypothetical protein M378DRAFT_185809 [Amanita muscaria Koide BX008]|uniref:NADP-dependent oxidoreductase domain-containing protein n=1 Tax=Amanita muscaria (strain Koide BX008) TaxID=946122 RepID=A0A0C2TJA3_AMAMK|nr:hypothetical protein M378DRAFT_185809 [Amanita muscaria Koide BX008]